MGARIPLLAWRPALLLSVALGLSFGVLSAQVPAQPQVLDSFTVVHGQNSVTYERIATPPLKPQPAPLPVSKTPDPAPAVSAEPGPAPEETAPTPIINLHARLHGDRWAEVMAWREVGTRSTFQTLLPLRWVDGIAFLDQSPAMLFLTTEDAGALAPVPPALSASKAGYVWLEPQKVDPAVGLVVAQLHANLLAKRAELHAAYLAREQQAKEAAWAAAQPRHDVIRYFPIQSSALSITDQAR